MTWEHEAYTQLPFREQLPDGMRCVKNSEHCRSAKRSRPRSITPGRDSLWPRKTRAIGQATRWQIGRDGRKHTSLAELLQKWEISFRIRASRTRLAKLPDTAAMATTTAS